MSPSLVLPFILRPVFITSTFSADGNQPLWGSLPEAFGTMLKLCNISSSSVCIMQITILPAGLQDGNLKTLGFRDSGHDKEPGEKVAELCAHRGVRKDSKLGVLCSHPSLR